MEAESFWRTIILALAGQSSLVGLAMTDIIERAEAALAQQWDARSDTQRAALVPELIEALKAARAEIERLLRYITESRA